MTWFETVPVILAAAVIIFAPGAILARALGARGVAWMASAAPLSVSLVAVGAIAADVVHLTWNPAVLGVFTLFTSTLAWGVCRLVARRVGGSAVAQLARPAKALVLAGLGGLTLGTAAISLRLTQTFLEPENISQTYDNVHHLSAIRAILESGNGSSLKVGSLIHNGAAGLYPYAWHDLVALTVQLTNATVPVAVNSVNIVVGALVWTAGCMYLATRVAGVRPAVLLLSGVLGAGFGSFPALALGWGVLYPNFLAIALLPAFVGLVVEVLEISCGRRLHSVHALVILLAGAPGLALAHPNIVMALGAITIPILFFWMLRLWTRGALPMKLKVAAVAAVTLYLAVFVVVWDRIRPSAAGSHWPPTLPMPVAILEALTISPLAVPLSWPVFVLTAMGIVVVCVHWRRLWALGAFLVTGMFFVVTASFPAEALRNSITGVFFNDSNRLASLLPVMALPLMVAGAVWAFDLAVKLVPRKSLERGRVDVVVASVGILAALAVGTSVQNHALTATVELMSEHYASAPQSWLLSSDEAALIKRAPEHIPAEATVIGHPANGGSLIYALEGIGTIMPSLSTPQSPAVKTIFAHLPEKAVNPDVCAAIRSLDAYYVLDFGSGRQVSDMRMTIPSTEDLSVTPGLVLLDEEGPARLFRIDGCQ